MELIETIDEAVFQEWRTTIENAATLYHGDEVKTDGTHRHYNVVDQLARYLTVHQIDFVTDPSNPRADEVDEEILARMYHFLRWQSMEFGIWEARPPSKDRLKRRPSPAEGPRNVINIQRPDGTIETPHDRFYR